MCKWIVEQWRDGECVKCLEFEKDVDVRQQKDGSITITFPSKELAGGWVIAIEDTLHIRRVLR